MFTQTTIIEFQKMESQMMDPKNSIHHWQNTGYTTPVERNNLKNRNPPRRGRKNPTWNLNRK